MARHKSLLTLQHHKGNFCGTILNLGEGAKLATVNFQMDNFDTRKLDGAKPDIIKQNETNLATPLS